MDQVKIGKFIATMRKEKGLTQKQLADRLNVTDKTISKWETGCRLPDASILPELGSVLEIDMNELLAGEKFSSENYVEKSENNIVGLVSVLDEIDKKNKSRNVGTIIGILLVGLSFLYLFYASLQIGKVMDIFDWPTLCYLLGVKFMILSISGGFYDYVNAWRVVLLAKKLSDKEINLSLQAVKYVDALTFTLGGLISMLSLFSLLNYMEDTSFIYPALAQIALIFFYVAVMKTVYVIVIYRLKHIMHVRQRGQEG